MTELRLYPFQNDCVSDLRAAIMRSMSAALVLSTGAGKTVIAGRVAQLAAAKGSTTLLLVHRRELVRQSIKTLKLAVPGMPIGVEAAGWPAMPWAKLHVGMVQSIARREFTCNPDIVIVDEAHHARAPTWEKVLARWPHAVRIGLTATPERLDGRGLGEHFQEMVLGPPMAWLVENSYLAPTRTLTVPSSWEDMASVRRTKSGDYRSKDLAERVTDRVVADAAKAYMRHTPGQQAIFFGVDTNHSKMVCAKLRDYGIAAEHVDGKDHEARRDRIMAEFSERRIQVVGNCDLICLDDQTEILTRCGWRGIDEMRDDDIVANWHLDGTITFGPIRSLIRRETTAHERMVSYLSPREIKFRVTSNHRMVHRKRDGAWQVTDAHSIVGQRVIVPVAGVAAPETPPMPAPRRPRLTKAARIRATSYNLRQRHGMGHAQARAEAERRIDRRDALAYTEPSSLTLDDCAFIGFWLGDGSRTEFPGGGVEYKLFQSTRYESIVAWVDRTITECGFDSIRRVSDYGDGQYRLVSWSLPRGTGHGPQQRDGVFRLEPYLDKDGSDLLWGLDRDQFAELLRGFHRADGLHRQHGDTVTITNTRKALMELLQTIAVCRGMRANIRRSDNGPRATTPIWRLSVSFHRGRDRTRCRIGADHRRRPHHRTCLVREQRLDVHRHSAQRTSRCHGQQRGVRRPVVRCGHHGPSHQLGAGVPPAGRAADAV